jgi:hypothetical protein
MSLFNRLQQRFANQSLLSPQSYTGLQELHGRHKDILIADLRGSKEAFTLTIIIRKSRSHYDETAYELGQELIAIGEKESLIMTSFSKSTEQMYEMRFQRSYE